MLLTHPFHIFNIHTTNGEQMLRSSFIVFCLLLSCIPVSAQPPDTLWTRTFGGDNYNTGYSIQQTDDSGYIIVGTTRSFGAGHYDAWLIKTDSTGEEEWNRTFGGDSWDLGYCVQQTNDHGYIITGQTHSFGAGENDVWLIKTDSIGNEEWNQSFGGTERDQGEFVQQTNDGGYIIIGHTYSFGAGDCDAWLIKTDSTGNEEWNQTFGGINDDCGKSGQQTSEGGYVIAGITESFGVRHSDVWLIKTDSIGNEEWNQTFGGTDGDQGNGVQQTNDGGYIIAAGSASFGTGLYDVYLIKTDSTGNREWWRTYGGTNLDNSFSASQTFDGGYIVTGITSSYGAGHRDVWVMKINSQGNKEWDQTFGGNRDDYGFSVQQTNDGGYIVTGETYSFDAGNTAVWVIRLAAEETKIIESTTSSPIDYILEEIYPNPFNSSTTISVGLPAPSELKLNIFNITGQEVAILANEYYSPGYHHFTFNADELPSGIYFIHASVPGKMDEVRKVVLVK